MSTRAAICTRGCNGSFRGRYHHWDGYPSGLGAELVDVYYDVFKGSIPAMVKTLIEDHPAGWSTIVNADWSQQPGFSEFTKRRCAKCGFPWKSHKEDLAQKGWLNHQFEPIESNQPQCYCHGERQEHEQIITSENAAGCGVEWVYVLEPGNGSADGIDVYEATYGGEHSVGMFGAGNPGADFTLRAQIKFGSGAQGHEAAKAKMLAVR